ncbi:MAG: hypothetical protein EBT15_07315 [Betaproteobacteria bacterium]|nr:hypothetical protein [Betaproteobacteria bacterium]
MAHTPGPWWIAEDGDYLCVCDGEVNEYGEREEVATLACNRPSLRHCQPANARLIAAAPALLAICGEFIAWEQDPDRYSGDLADLASQARSVVERVVGVPMEGTNGKERSLD